MPLQIPFDTAGLDPRTATAFEDLIAILSKYFDDTTASYSGAGSFFQPRCHYFLGSAQSISNDTDTAISFTADGQAQDVTIAQIEKVNYDNGALFSDRGKFLRVDGPWLTPPLSGQYLVIANVVFAANATGQRQVWVEQRSLNNVTFDWARVSEPSTNAAAVTRTQVSTIVTVRDPTSTHEDAFRVVVRQNSGGALNAGSGFTGTSVQMIKLS